MFKPDQLNNRGDHGARTKRIHQGKQDRNNPENKYPDQTIMLIIIPFTSQ